MKHVVKWVIVAGILGVFAAAKAAPGTRTITARQPLGGGFVFSWTQRGSSGPQAMGLTLTASALEGLPQHDQVVVLVPPPSLRVAPYRHFTVDWNPHGHDPQAIYGVPHFDFHFFFISSKTREGISCLGADEKRCMTAPDPMEIAADYVPTPQGVPRMGWHWVDSKSPEFGGQPFTSTFIYGYYDGHLEFLEPMVALDFLKGRPQASFPIKQPAKVHRSGWYPEKYEVRFEAPTGSVEVILTDFRRR